MEIYRNSQWVVKDGIVAPVDERLSQGFELGEIFKETKRGDKTYYEWPTHFAEKTWVDVGLFIDTFEAAIKHQSELTGVPVDQKMLRESFAEARRIASRPRIKKPLL